MNTVAKVPSIDDLIPNMGRYLQKAYEEAGNRNYQAVEALMEDWVEQMRRNPATLRLNAHGIYYRALNKLVREAVRRGVTQVELANVNGQRYLACGLEYPAKIDVYGVPGNDLGAFMNGPEVMVHNNAQDCLGNTMNDGKIVVHGDAGDVLGYGMRGGKMHIRGDVGYRVGIHMKEYQDKVPVIIAGGIARDFFGEYMAGGTLILLGLNRPNDQPIVGDYVGTGMHGGVIYIRGSVPAHHLGKEVGVRPITEEDKARLTRCLSEFCADFSLDLSEVMSEPFIKLLPVSLRPYGKLYSY